MYIPHNIRYIKIFYGKCSNTSVSNHTMFFFSRAIIGRDRCLSSRLARWTRYRTTRRKNVRPEIFCPMLTSNSKLCQHHQACIHYFFFFFACFSQRLDYRSGDCSNIGAVVHEALRRTYRRLKNIQNITRFHKYINIYLVFKIYTHCLLLIRHLSISSSLISKLIRMS